MRGETPIHPTGRQPSRIGDADAAPSSGPPAHLLPQGEKDAIGPIAALQIRRQPSQFQRPTRCFPATPCGASVLNPPQGQRPL